MKGINRFIKWRLGTLISTVILGVFLLAGCSGSDSSPVAGIATPPGGNPVPPGPAQVTPLDSDGDGVPNTQDAFPNDAAASVDSDGDGFPDAFNTLATDAQLAATKLILDAFPNDPAAAVDTDGDGMPDAFLPTATPGQIAASKLVVDADDDNDGVPDVTDPAPVLGISNIPTGAPATPTFGALPFEQKMVRFEEFGVDDYPTVAADPWTDLPQPQDFQNGPVSAVLDAFLAQAGVSPLPTPASNVFVENPWNATIETFLGRALEPLAPLGVAGPAEGRPSGDNWAHQGWDNLFPQKFFKTTVGQARTNLGLRDTRQRHGYALGEFAPGGLYHKVYDAPGVPADAFLGTTAGIPIALHPNMPIQNPNTVWTFDGTLPPKLLQVRYGEPVLMRNYNTLPIDPTANHPLVLDNTMVTNGFGRHTITTHDHNGHSPGESDGFAWAFFFPGQFYDYRWPLQLAGYSNNINAAGAINFDATEPKAAIPCEAGETFTVLINGVPTPKTCDATGRVNIPGDWRETMSTHWFHDHMLDYTAQNVYKGNATMMDYFSAIDRGNEEINDGVNLRLPSGTALSWGNRDYDVHLLVADKATDQNGQLWYNTADREGFCGDVMTVNWLYKPYFEVRDRKYRFRFLNGAVSRIMAIGLVQEVNIPAGQPGAGELPGPAGSGKSYNRVPFHMIANDGNIMEHAVPFDGVFDVFHDGNPDAWKGQLPSQTIAERYDIIVDFAKHGIKPGDKLYFVNIMEHADGKGTKSKVPMADILSGKYAPVVNNGRWINGDPGVGKFLELRVVAKAAGQVDLSMDPVAYEPGKAKMIPLAIDRVARTVNGVSLDTAMHRTFEFVTSGGLDKTTPVGFGIPLRDEKDDLLVPGEEELQLHGPWFVKVDGGATNAANPKRISVIETGDLAVYTIKTGRGWTHPVHIHFEEGIILTRGGKYPPEWEVWARKDMYRIGPENDSTGEMEVAYRSRDFAGHYVTHCHNTLHEDHAMLLRWDNRAGLVAVDTPLPTWDGVLFEPSFALDTAGVGDGGVGPVRGIPLN